MLGAAADGTDSPPPSKIPRDKSTDKLYHVQSPQPSPSVVTDNPTAGMVIDDVSDLFDVTTGGLLGTEVGVTVADSPALTPQTSDEFVVTTQTLPEAANITDSLEPLAIQNTDYHASLELTDVLDSDDVTPVVSIEDILSTDAGGTMVGIDAQVAGSCTSAATGTVGSSTCVSSVVNPLLTSTALAVSEPRSSSDFGRNDLTVHIDSTYSQLSGLRELLASSPQITIDPNMMFELFGLLDSNISAPLCTEDNDETPSSSTTAQSKQDSNNGLIVGNELIQYTTLDDFSNMYDTSDLVSSYPNFFDSPEFTTDTVMPSTLEHDDIIGEVCLATPRPAVAAASCKIKKEKVMEDVD
jgi:hypothetical protein